MSQLDKSINLLTDIELIKKELDTVEILINKIYDSPYSSKDEVDEAEKRYHTALRAYNRACKERDKKE